MPIMVCNRNREHSQNKSHPKVAHLCFLFFAGFFFPQRALDNSRICSDLCSCVSFDTRALPPLLPSDTAAGSFFSLDFFAAPVAGDDLLVVAVFDANLALPRQTACKSGYISRT